MMDEATANGLYNAYVTAAGIGSRTDGKAMLKIFGTYLRIINDSRNKTN